MLWPLTLLARAKPAAPTIDDVRRARQEAAQFELLDALEESERAAYKVDMLRARCERLASELS